MTTAQATKPEVKAETKPTVAAAPPASTTPAKPATPAAKSKESVIGTQLDIPAAVDPVLVTILSWIRPHGTPHELAFCEWLTKTLEDLGHKVVKWEEGSMFVDIPHPGGRASTSLFSCHVDTVDFLQPGTPLDTRKKLAYDPNFGHITLDKDSAGTCLGADDGAGVWIMLNMIASGVPGGYLFHRGEERGGISATANARKRSLELKRFDLAVAFDRPRTDEIITHQGGVECASRKFAEALAGQLNQHGFSYKPSARGVYTDTKEYRKIVAECINIGVGYEQQHGKNEFQDYAHLKALTEACIKINWDALPVDRDPSKADVYSYTHKRGGYGNLSWAQADLDGLDSDTVDTRVAAVPAKGAAPGGASKPTKGEQDLTPLQEILMNMECGGVSELVWLAEHESRHFVAAFIELLRERNALEAEVDTLELIISGDLQQ